MNDAKEKARAFLDKVKERLKNLKNVSKKVWIIVAAVLVVLIVAIAVILTLNSKNKQEYAVLVTQVSDTEASTILNFLSEQGVTTYKVEKGNTILVPANQEAGLKARILMANLNQTGSYYMDNLNAFSTNEERSYADRMDLQQRMAGVIRNFENVVDATVNITPGENRAYILDSNNVVNASAAVNVTMVEGTLLSDGAAEAIRDFVTHSVQGLQIDYVSVTDSRGNIYLSDEGGLSSDESSALKLQLQRTMENRIRTEVMNVLTPFFGEENVRVAVTCEVEVDRTTEQRTVIGLPEYAQDGSTGGRGIIRSEQSEYYAGRTGEELAGGLVGTEPNADLVEEVEALAQPQAGDNTYGGSRQTDYENSRSEMQIDNNGAAKLTDCTIGVSINSRVTGEDFDANAIRRLTARASGIAGELDPITGEEYLNNKIEVISMDFYDPNAIIDPNASGGGVGGQGGIPLWVLLAAGGGLLLFVLLLVLILNLRKRKRKRIEEQEEQERREMEAMMVAAGMVEDDSPDGGADVMELEMERGMELRKDIRQFVSDNPEIAAQMIKAWLRGGDENG